MLSTEDSQEDRPSQQDISRRAVSLGRLVDRLPEGVYVLRLVKAEQVWRVEVSVQRHLQLLELRR